MGGGRAEAQSPRVGASARVWGGGQPGRQHAGAVAAAPEKAGHIPCPQLGIAPPALPLPLLSQTAQALLACWPLPGNWEESLDFLNWEKNLDYQCHEYGIYGSTGNERLKNWKSEKNIILTNSRLSFDCGFLQMSHR